MTNEELKQSRAEEAAERAEYWDANGYDSDGQRSPSPLHEREPSPEPYCGDPDDLW